MSDETTPDIGSGSESPDTIKVMVIHNEGAGFANAVDYPKGTTAMQVFKEMVGKLAKPENYKIRLTRCGQIVQAGDTEVLQNNDRLTMTPTKIEGQNS
jgi:hypothetical protein